MSLPLSIIPAKKRHRRKRRAVQFGAPPVVVNQIVSVAPGEDPDGIDVTITGILGNIDDLYEGFQVKVGEDWELPSSYDMSALPVVRFTFGADVSGATEWVVPDPGQWFFEDEQPLSEPFSGEIE